MIITDSISVPNQNSLLAKNSPPKAGCHSVIMMTLQSEVKKDMVKADCSNLFCHQSSVVSVVSVVSVGRISFVSYLMWHASRRLAVMT